MLSADDLARLAKGATEGPFTFGKTREGERMILGGPHGQYVANITIHQTPRKMGMMDEPERESNAALILALVNSLPQIEAALRLAEAVDRAESDGTDPDFRREETRSALTAYRTSKGE